MSRTAIAYLGPEDPQDLADAMLPAGLVVHALIVEPAGAREPHRLAEALDVIARREADTLLLSTLRTAADSLGALVRLLGWLEQAGGSLIALDLGLDTLDGSVRDANALLRVIDSWERDRGPHRPPRGRPGLGHADPDLAERIAALRARGLSLQAVARELNEAGIPTPRGGREWRASSVQSALGYRRPRPPAPGAPPRPPAPPRGRPMGLPPAPEPHRRGPEKP
jgi:DNA invertase Pin-like site-specific DNA recombinase